MATRTEGPPLGTCPVCAADIPPRNLGVSYRSPGDWPRMLAECPVCGVAVHPE